MKKASFKELDKSWLFFAPIFVGLLALDQFSKWWALENLRLGDSVDYGFELSYNEGIVFGINLPQWAIWVMAVGILALGVSLIWENKQWRDKWHLTGFAMILAGAIGNLIDRIRFGYVVDFIKVFWWPNFNLADVFIVLAVMLFAWEFLIREDKISKI